MNSQSNARIRFAALKPDHPDHDAIVTTVDALGPAPHVLCLSGTMDLDSDAILRSLTRRLNELLPDCDFYYPFVNRRPRTRNPPGLWLSAQHIHPGADHRLSSSTTFPNTVETMIAGGHVWLRAVHGLDPVAPIGSPERSAMDGQLASVPAVLLGTFDHHERILRTGFWDAAQAVVDLTPAAGSPDTRILVSRTTPARLVVGNHILTPATDSGSHAGVACDLNFEFPSERPTGIDKP